MQGPGLCLGRAWTSSSGWTLLHSPTRMERWPLAGLHSVFAAGAPCSSPDPSPGGRLISACGSGSLRLGLVRSLNTEVRPQPVSWRGRTPAARGGGPAGSPSCPARLREPPGASPGAGGCGDRVRGGGVKALQPPADRAPSLHSRGSGQRRQRLGGWLLGKQGSETEPGATAPLYQREAGRGVPAALCSGEAGLSLGRGALVTPSDRPRPGSLAPCLLCLRRVLSPPPAQPRVRRLSSFRGVGASGRWGWRCTRVRLGQPPLGVLWGVVCDKRQQRVCAPRNALGTRFRARDPVPPPGLLSAGGCSLNTPLCRGSGCEGGPEAGDQTPPG